MKPSSYRSLEIAGRFNSEPSLRITFDGKAYSARPGEPLGITLLAHGVRTLGRSGKYHRPRGLFCARGSCGNCVARVNGVSNERLCLHEAKPGSEVVAQNTLGGASRDVLGAIDWLFPQGLDHHHLMTHMGPLNTLTVQVARHLAGLGTLPDVSAAKTRVEPTDVKVDVAVVGCGAAGQSVVSALGDTGLSVEAFDLGAEKSAAVVGYYDDKYLVVVRGQELLWVQPRSIVVATGAYDLPPTCDGNDLPGVLSLRAAERCLAFGVVPGKRMVVGIDSKADEATAARAWSWVRALRDASVDVLAVVERTSSGERGSVVDEIAAIDGVQGVRGVQLAQSGERMACDAVVWAGKTSPAYELPRQLGVAAPFVAERGAFVPSCDANGRTSRKGIFLAGEVAGVEASRARDHGQKVAAAVMEDLRAGRAL